MSFNAIGSWNAVTVNDTTDAIEVTALVLTLGATVFSCWVLRRLLEQRRLAAEDAVLRQHASRRVAVGLFHVLKPLVLSLSLFWCMFLYEGPTQAAIKNVAITIVSLLLLSRSLYEHWEGRLWFGPDRRRAPRK